MYLRLLVLLLCIALSIILILAGSLFLNDYMPVGQSGINRIHQQQLLWKPAIEQLQHSPPENADAVLDRLAGHDLDTRNADFSWLLRQNNPKLTSALQQLRTAQQAFEQAQGMHAALEQRLQYARDIDRAYDQMEDAVLYDMEVKQSVISLLQLVGLLMAVSCLIAIALGGRRILVDRLDRLISFVPNNLVDATHAANEDEFFHLEQKVLGITTRLEGYIAETTWAKQTSERLRSMVRAQDFLRRFMETISRENVLSETTLRKLLFALEKALNASNVAVVFANGNALVRADQPIYTAHVPCALDDDLLQELSQTSTLTFMTHNSDRLEVGCLAVAFSSANDALDVLLVETDKGRLLEDTEIQFVELAAQLMAMAMGYQGRDQEGRRIALLEERAAIARELHDSLAQSLSFMKIQIARLQAQDKSEEADGNAAVITELRAGLDNAYRELRELLSTFRVHMDVRGLKFAVQSAIDEFAQRSSLSITLDNRLVNCRLTVNEEFHILHVVREALSNIIRHAGANNVAIALVYQSNGSVMVTIDDDGIGFRPSDDGQDHYGQAIMKERAYSLGGDIEVMARRNGGTRVRLVFTPKLPQ